MAEYIDKDIFLSCEINQYCMNCERRKNSKGKLVYAIGDAPCRACGIGDVLDDVEVFHAADVRPVVLCGDCIHFQPFRAYDGFCKIDGMLWYNDFFCANGKRRMEEDHETVI